MNRSNWDVAPHGFVMVAVAMLLLILFIHMVGFRIVGALKVGR